MTDKLSDKDRDSLVAYRLERALSTLSEADFNANGGYYNTAVNRLYYAACYAAIALMLEYGLDAVTHKGVKTMLSLHFIRTGKLGEEYGRIMTTLYENRQSGDYEDFVYCDSTTYSYLRPQAQFFINGICRLVNAEKE